MSQLDKDVIDRFVKEVEPTEKERKIIEEYRNSEEALVSLETLVRELNLENIN